MSGTPRHIAEYRGVDRTVFHNDIVPMQQPAILKGFAEHWPAVSAGQDSPQALCAYLGRFDARKNVNTLLGPPTIKGRFFYNNDLSGLNFERRQEPLGTAIARLLEHLDVTVPPAIAVQATIIEDSLPGFVEENPNSLLDVAPRLWINNATIVATHFDPMENIACVVAGRRRFTVFPPEQTPNLYIGPLDLTPAGAPVSMVSVTEPELERYPRFREALAQAQTAELAPGDAIYIPYLWWHHVESLEPINLLVNYWWNPAAVGLGAPFDCIFHGVMAIGSLPPNQRKAWRALFDHYVFRLQTDPAAHLPAARQGLLGPMTPDRARDMKAMLLRALNR